MTRAERVAQAQELRAEGLTWREIGERLGVGRSTAHEYVTDPDLSRHRERRFQRAGSCVDCGTPTDASHSEPALRCAECAKPVAAELLRASWAPYQKLIEEMWAEGMTARQIGDALGWTFRNPGTHISQLRARGYDLPHRRTPEQLARIVVGAEERMAKARATYRAMRAA